MKTFSTSKRSIVVIALSLAVGCIDSDEVADDEPSGQDLGAADAPSDPGSEAEGYCTRGIDCWGQLPIPSCSGTFYGHQCDLETFECFSTCSDDEQLPAPSTECATQDDCRMYDRFTADGKSCECVAGNAATAPELELSCNNLPCANNLVWCDDGVCRTAWFGGI